MRGLRLARERCYPLDRRALSTGALRAHPFFLLLASALREARSTTQLTTPLFAPNVQAPHLSQLNKLGTPSARGKRFVLISVITATDKGRPARYLSGWSASQMVLEPFWQASLHTASIPVEDLRRVRK
jgi:hypothetical protein